MDYVVFGMGYGATLMLLGWVLRTFGPGLRYRATDHAPSLSGKQLLARTSWRRFASGLGAVIATAGLALVVLTFVLILIHPGNDAGVLSVVIAVAAIVVAVAAWLWLYAGRYGTYGLVPVRSAPAPARSSEPAGSRPLIPTKTPQEAPGQSSVIAPALEHAPSDVAAGANLEPAMALADQDPYGFGPTNVDDDDAAQTEIRMSRFHVHHPLAEFDEVVNDDDEARDSPDTRGDDVDAHQLAPEGVAADDDAGEGIADAAVETPADGDSDPADDPEPGGEPAMDVADVPAGESPESGDTHSDPDIATEPADDAPVNQVNRPRAAGTRRAIGGSEP